MKKILSIVLMSAMIISLVLPVIAAPDPDPVPENFEFDAETGTITRYIGTGGNVEIPAEIGGVTVTAIGEEAFFGCQNLIKVTIPNGVTAIGVEAFANCQNLTEVKIPSSVTTIGEYAFVSCQKLTALYFEHLDAETITSIGNNIFSNQYGTAIIYSKDAENFTTPRWHGYFAYPESPELPELNVTVDKNKVNEGQFFNVNAEFAETVNGNTAIITYKYDPAKFTYKDFTPEKGVDVVSTRESSGILQITVMIQKYNMKKFGNALFSARRYIDFNDEQNKISVEIECVVKEDDVKSVAFSKGTTPSQGIPNNNNYNLIDLSNIIDIFGFNNTMANWETEYRRYDFNDNGVIDISDISTIARSINTFMDSNYNTSYGYVMSSPSYMTREDGKFVRVYTIYDFSERKQKVIYDDANNEIYCQIGDYIRYSTQDSTTHSIVGRVNPLTTGNLSENSFLNSNEVGWVVSGNVNSTSDTFNGFYYDPSTKVAYIGNPGVDILANTISLKANIGYYTTIFIYDVKNPSKVNMITRAQLDSFIEAAAGNQEAISSAFVTGYGDYYDGVIYNTRMLCLGLNSDNSIANDYINAPTYAQVENIRRDEPIVIGDATYVKAEVRPETMYYNYSPETILISEADPLYAGISGGSIVSISQSNSKTVDGEKYRVGQLIFNSEDDILTNDYLNYLVQSDHRLIANYNIRGDENIYFETYGTVWGRVNDDLKFINLTLTKNSAGKITGYSINNKETGLKIGAATTPATSFSTVPYNWVGFNSIRKSVPDIQLSDLSNWGRNVTGSWYVAGHCTVIIYVSEIITE